MFGKKYSGQLVKLIKGITRIFLISAILVFGAVGLNKVIKVKEKYIIWHT